MARNVRPYEEGLHERLRDLSHAANYIKAADSIDGFLLALRDVAEATKGMSGVANAAEKDRVNLYRMLSKDGNPRLDSLWPVLEAMGLRLSVEPIEHPKTSSDAPLGENHGVNNSHAVTEEGNSLSGGHDDQVYPLALGTMTLTAQARKGPSRASGNFASIGGSIINQQTGVNVGRQQ
jgi:DNA-binding phage protein